MTTKTLHANDDLWGDDTIGEREESWHIKHEYHKADPWSFDTLDEAIGAFNAIVLTAHEYAHDYKQITLWHYSYIKTAYQRITVETLLRSHDLVKEESGAYYGGP